MFVYERQEQQIHQQQQQQCPIVQQLQTENQTKAQSVVFTGNKFIVLTPVASNQLLVYIKNFTSIVYFELKWLKLTLG